MVRRLVLFCTRTVITTVFVVLLGVSFLTAQEPPTSTPPPPTCTNELPIVDVTFIYAPESLYYEVDGGIIDEFHKSTCFTSSPVNPSDNTPLEYNIRIIAEPGSSGFITDAIVNRLNPNSPDKNESVPPIEQIPVLWQPSIKRWLQLVNFRTNQPVYILENARATTHEPSVIAIWDRYYQALRAEFGDNIGWEELLSVHTHPEGWCRFESLKNDCRRAVFYGHTNPFLSSTALDMLMAQFYAATGIKADLTLQQVNDPNIRQIVRQYQSMARHYASITTVFREYLILGSDYIDFVALDENSLIGINQGVYGKTPPEQLVALYPKEGVFWQDRPLAISNVLDVNKDQRDAAKTFTDFVLTEPIQRVIMSYGFRPVDTNIQLDNSFWGGCTIPQCGVTPGGPAAILEPPAAGSLDVIHAVQQSWNDVRRQADITLLFDISGSMAEIADFTTGKTKLAFAQEAAAQLIRELQANNPNATIRLITFNKAVTIEKNSGTVADVGDQLIATIMAIPPGDVNENADTNLHESVLVAINQMNALPGNNLRAVVLLSDGQETTGIYSEDQVLAAITGTWQTKNPVFVLPIAYGNNADTDALKAIGAASFVLDPDTDLSYFAADVEEIEELLKSLIPYF